MTQDLVVISFERDIPLLNVFVKSVDKFVTENLFENFWLVITDDTSIEKFQCLENSKFAWKTVYANDIFKLHTEGKMAGYINQMISKLAVSKIIESDWYWLFDSKNFLLKNINHDTLYRNEKALLPIDNLSEYWANGYYKTLEYFNIPFRSPIINNTPYAIHTNSAKNIFLEYNNFEELFAALYEKDKICEFFFYNAYIIKQQLFDNLYQPHGNIRVTIWPTELHESNYQPEYLKNFLINHYDENYVWCGGLHRTAIAAMDDQLKEKWADFLLFLNLFDSKDQVYEWYNIVNINSANLY